MNELVDNAYQVLEKLRLMIKEQNKLFFEIGGTLKMFRDTGLFRELGDGGYDTFPSFIASGELGIAKSTAQAYITLYEFWIEEKGYSLEVLSEIPYDKLRMVLPSAREAKTDNEVSELFNKAKVLSRSDLLIELGKSETGKSKFKTVILQLCEKCGGYKYSEGIIQCFCKN